jgi:FAD:protein FMN transferase
MKLFLKSTAIALCLLSFVRCSETEKTQKIQEFAMSGNTQGTTFTIKIVDEKCNVDAKDVITALAMFDSVLNSYIPNSLISKINAQDVGTKAYADPKGFFTKCFQKSRFAYQETEGAFEPSIFPLVKGWGFFKDENTVLDNAKVKELLALINFTEGKYFDIDFNNDSVYFTKKQKDFKLDFNAIAQGYAVDVLAELIASKNHFSYYVEIGGELRVCGLNKSGKNWKIGIDKPTDDKNPKADRAVETIVSLPTGALATSGNYRKFYIKDGKKYAHILDPKTGFPVSHNLLSATVFADETAFADAFATAFMVMGVEKVQDYLANNKKIKLEVFLIYTNKDGKIESWKSKGFENF